MASVTYQPGFGGPSTINHGDTVTITGTGFGSKPAGPGPGGGPVWDDCSGPDSVLDRWDQAWPNAGSNPQDRNIRRRNVHRGVQPPHGWTGRYISGCHFIGPDSGSADKGGNVLVGKRWPRTDPADIYLSYWFRGDPAWVFSGGSNDDNFKLSKWAVSGGVINVAVPPDGFTDNYPGGWPPTSLTDASIKRNVYSSSADIRFPDGPGSQSIYGSPSDCVNPMTQWVKFENIYRLNSAVAGFVQLYENGRRVLNHAGRVNIPAGAFQYITVGHFARQFGTATATNWRYFADVYLDTTLARVQLVNNADFAAFPSIRENQIPEAWSPTSVQFRCWQGAHTTLDGTRLFIVTPTGTPLLVATLSANGGPSVDPPIITSRLAAAGVQHASFTYGITATQSPTSRNASNLPAGLGVNVSTGVISGNPTGTGDRLVPISAANAAGVADETLALVVRPPTSASGSDTKPTAPGQAPNPGHPLATDLLISWLCNEGNDPSPAAALINGGSGGATYDVTLDYTDVGQLTWLDQGAGIFDLTVANTATDESPSTLSTPVNTGTTWTLELSYTPQAGGNSTQVLFGNGQTVSSATKGPMVSGGSGGRTFLQYDGVSHTARAAVFAFDEPWHVVIAVDAGNVQFYVNGIAGNSFTGVPSFTLDRLFTHLGAQSFVGIIHHIRYWQGRALTATEAEALFLTPYDMYAAVSGPPVISSPLTAEGDQGEPFVYGIVADPLPESYDAIGLPAGLLVDQDLGVIYGSPTVNGVFNVTIQATNSFGSDSETLVITIAAAPEPPVITSPLFADGVEGTAFSYQITATGTPTSFDATDLPAGLTVNTATGLIDGTPTVNGTFPIPISATNADGTDDETLVLTIAPTPVAPVITSPLTATGTVGVPFSYLITATGDEVIFDVDTADLPAGLLFEEPEIPEIDGTPTVDGAFPVDISATNPAGTDNEVLTITIAPAPADVPTITSPLAASGQVGEAFTYQIVATGDPFDYLAINLPGGLLINNATGVISGTPTQFGVFSVGLSAINGAGTSPVVILALTIAPAEPEPPTPGEPVVIIPPYGTTFEQTRREFLDEFLMFVGEVGDADAEDVAERLLNRVILGIWQKRTWQQFVLPTPHLITTLAGVRHYGLPSYFGRVSNRDGKIRNLTRRQEIWPIEREHLQAMYPSLGTASESPAMPVYYVISGTQGTPVQPSADGELVEVLSDSASDSGIRVVVGGFGPTQDEQRVSLTLSGTTPIAAGSAPWAFLTAFAKAVPAAGVTLPTEFHSSHGTVTIRVAGGGRELGKLAPRESSRKQQILDLYPKPQGGLQIAIPIYRQPSGLIYDADPLPLGWRDAIFEECIIQWRINTGEQALDGDTDRIPRPKLHDLISDDNLNRPRPRIRPFTGGGWW